MVVIRRNHWGHGDQALRNAGRLAGHVEVGPEEPSEGGGSGDVALEAHAGEVDEESDLEQDEGDDGPCGSDCDCGQKGPESGHEERCTGPRGHIDSAGRTGWEAYFTADCEEVGQNGSPNDDEPIMERGVGVHRNYVV